MEIKSDITTEEKCCEFFRDELRRCYREMEQYEKKIEQLENQKMDLVEELAKKNLARYARAGFSTEADKEI